MPRLPLIIFLALLAPLALAARAAAAVHAALAFPDALRAGHIELLRVTVDAQPAQAMLTVSVQDARGGPSFERSGRTDDQGTLDLLMPLPAVEVDALPDGQWPVLISISGAQGMLAQQFNVVRPAAGAPAYRLLMAVGAARPPEALDVFAQRPVVALALDRGRLLSAPPLVWAGADGLWLDSQTVDALNKLPDDQPRPTAEGLTLIAAGAASPRGDLANWLWAYHSGSGLWTAPQAGLPPLVVVLPDLATIPVVAVAFPRGARLAGISLVVACIAACLILAAFVRQPRWLLPLAAAVLVGLAIGWISLLRATAPPTQTQAAWTLHYGSGVALDETVLTTAAALPTTQRMPAGPLPWLPVAPDAAAYWGLRDVTVQVDDNVTTERQPPGAVRAFYTRRLRPMPPRSGAVSGWLVSNGQVFAPSELASPTSTPASGPAQASRGVTFPEFARQQPATALRSLATWYALRYDARYDVTITNPDADRVDIHLP